MKIQYRHVVRKPVEMSTFRPTPQTAFRRPSLRIRHAAGQRISFNVLAHCLCGAHHRLSAAEVINSMNGKQMLICLLHGIYDVARFMLRAKE